MKDTYRNRSLMRVCRRWLSKLGLCAVFLAALLLVILQPWSIK